MASRSICGSARETARPPRPTKRPRPNSPRRWPSRTSGFATVSVTTLRRVLDVGLEGFDRTDIWRSACLREANDRPKPHLLRRNLAQRGTVISERGPEGPQHLPESPGRRIDTAGDRFEADTSHRIDAALVKSEPSERHARLLALAGAFRRRSILTTWNRRAKWSRLS
jgi:hypothetical protein